MRRLIDNDWLAALLLVLLVWGFITGAMQDAGYCEAAPARCEPAWLVPASEAAP